MTAPASSIHNAVVLLVQPRDDGRDMYREFLRHHQVVPIAVSTGRHALTMASHADVIITGILLPGEIDGLDLIRRLRAGERTRNKPIIVLTSCAWDTERQRAEDAGCDVFLTKPCLPIDLLREVRRVLRASKLRVVRATTAKRHLTGQRFHEQRNANKRSA